MSEWTPSFGQRAGLAFAAFWRVLTDPGFAAVVWREYTGERQPGVPAAAAAPALKETPPESALQLLGLLQQEGRLIDFLQEEVAGYSDAEVGAAVRVVHEGCRKALAEHLQLAPIREEPEGAPVTLERGFDAAAIRLTGNVSGEPPFHGTLAHRGWRVTEVRLPKLAPTHDTTVLAAAEVEL